MYVSRLQVENEGFLAGLDITFGLGLTVIIGARGTGKTSIIELIRFCLDAGGFTDDAVTRGKQQAMAILEGGTVTVELTDSVSGALTRVTRSSTGQPVGSIPRAVRATVLAQNEVEAVGAQSAGRLHLVDRFRADAVKQSQALASLRTELKSTARELHEVMQEGVNLQERVHDLQSVTDELSEARLHQQTLLANAKASSEDQERLLLSQKQANALAAREASVDQSAVELDALKTRVASVQSFAETMGSSDKSADAMGRLNRVVQATRQSVQLLSETHRVVAEAIASLENERAEIARERAELEGLTSELRQRLSALEEGIGAATRKMAELEERSGQLAALRSRLDGRVKRYSELSKHRDEQYRALEAHRDVVFEERREVASALTWKFAPTVRVMVERSSDTSDYQSAIVRTLRGTGVHYNAVAPLLASRVTPQELSMMVENRSVDSLSAATGLSRDRAASLVSAFAMTGLDDVVGSRIEDSVQLELLDGASYKPSDRLSIGQRCTAVLPLLLGANADPLLIDQPEDHLDNAFVADTLVAALRQRSASDQYIFTSHNANIPVLGEADQVVVMDSDGRRGFVSHRGRLTEPKTVSSVTSIMEGGAQAFRRRSTFYGQHGLLA